MLHTKNIEVVGEAIFWILAIVNAYILHKKCTIKNHNTLITHLKFQKNLLIELIGDFRGSKLRYPCRGSLIRRFISVEGILIKR